MNFFFRTDPVYFRELLFLNGADGNDPGTFFSKVSLDGFEYVRLEAGKIIIEHMTVESVNDHWYFTVRSRESSNGSRFTCVCVNNVRFEFADHLFYPSIGKIIA